MYPTMKLFHCLINRFTFLIGNLSSLTSWQPESRWEWGKIFGWFFSLSTRVEIKLPSCSIRLPLSTHQTALLVALREDKTIPSMKILFLCFKTFRRDDFNPGLKRRVDEFRIIKNALQRDEWQWSAITMLAAKIIFANFPSSQSLKSLWVEREAKTSLTVCEMENCLFSLEDCFSDGREWIRNCFEGVVCKWCHIEFQ